MDAQLQPSPTVYASANPQVHTQLPVTPQSSTPSYQAPISTPPRQETSSEFCTKDAVKVVFRGLATITETLYFLGRTVSIYAIKLGALVLGAIKGLLRHCHENESLNNRTVQPVQTLTVQSQAGQNQAGQNQKNGQVADTVVSGKMPLEEYIRVDATDTLNAIPKSIKKLGTIGGMACAFLTPYFFLGPLGLVINIPRICGVKPYATFDVLSDESEQIPTLPVTSQDSAANQQPESGLYAQPSKPATEGLTVGQNPTTQSSQQASLQQTPLTSQRPQESTVPPAQANLIAPQRLSQAPDLSATTPIMKPQYPQNPTPHFQQVAQQPALYQAAHHTPPLQAYDQQATNTPITSLPATSNQPTQPTPAYSNSTPSCPLWSNFAQNVPQLIPSMTLP